MPLELIKDDTLYIEVAPDPAGEYINRVWVKYDATIGTFTGLWSPYKDGETSMTLPEGVSSEETIIIHTVENLVVDNSAIGNEHTGSVIYLEDPAVNTSAQKYLIKDNKDWNANSGFQLITDYNEYMAVRERAT